jgi:hypothetical protein
LKTTYVVIWCKLVLSCRFKNLKQVSKEIIMSALFYVNKAKEIHPRPGLSLVSPETVAEKTPVNAVAASGVVTFTGTPLVHVNNVYASGTITITDLPVAEEVLTVGAQEFTFKALRAALGQITISATPATQAANIVAAITADLATVTAVQGTGGNTHIVTVTAVAAGVAGNALAFTEVATGVAVSGAGTLAGGVAHVHESIMIGTQEFIFVTARSGAGSFEITVNANNTTQAANLVAAILADVTNVTAANTDGVVTVTAAIKGTAGNLIALSETATGCAVSSVTSGKLDGGINGTEGLANEICANASYLYHCLAINTIADANWRRIALGSVY